MTTTQKEKADKLEKLVRMIKKQEEIIAKPTLIKGITFWSDTSLCNLYAELTDDAKGEILGVLERDLARNINTLESINI